MNINNIQDQFNNQISNHQIILFGFSGSGKSTLANMIGERYNLRVIHPSGILRDLYEKNNIDINHTRYNTGFWESSKGIKIFKDRLNEKEPLDMISDKIIIEEIHKENTIIDSWSLPWLVNKYVGTKIYLKADLEIRAQRVAIRSKIKYTKSLDVVSMKDEETRKLFQRLYEFDIKYNHDVFDYTINTNQLSKDESFKNICQYIENYRQ
jgi:cytidylate kinase